MKLRLRLLLLIMIKFFSVKMLPSRFGRLTLRVLPVDVDIKKVNIERFFAFGDLGWVSLLIDWKVFGNVVFGKYSMYGKCLSLSVKGPLYIFKKFEIQTSVIWCDNLWVYAEQRFVVNQEVVAISFIKGGALCGGRMLQTEKWMPLFTEVSLLDKPEVVRLHQVAEKAMWRESRAQARSILAHKKAQMVNG